MTGTRISSLLGNITILLAICCCSLSAQAKYGGGSGTAADPYRIYNAGQMNAIGADSNDWDKHFRLMANIDLGGFDGLNGNPSFNIIGNKSNPFLGVFNGNSHTIANFTYNEATQQNIGLFSHVTGSNAHIKNLGLIAPEINALTGGYHHVGTLVGYLSYGASITDCYVEDCNLHGYGTVGGLLGKSWGQTTLSNCYLTGTVLGTGFGGIVGGFVADSTSIISNCYSTANVSGDVPAGGMLGIIQEGTIFNCYFSGSVVSTGQDIGGLIGTLYSGTVTNSYSNGSVSGGSHVGGLVGYNNLFATISRSYSTGSVIGTGDRIGGLVGTGGGTVEDSFWDIQTSGQTSSNGGTGKTTAEMQTESTFMDAGWDFTTPIWKMCGWPYYPKLWWVECPERPIYYVDADANGASNGSSWEDAYNHLQDALAAAHYWSEIRVAQGTYKPGPLSPPPPPSSGGNESVATETVGYRTDTFELKNGVAVKGGFAGFGEPDPNARNIQLYKTILSGDLNGDDGPGFANNNDNCYHVVTCSGTYQHTVLDGCTITAGNANHSPGIGSIGGGMLNNSGSPTVVNCMFSANSAVSGGGMYNLEGSNPTISNCTFSENSVSGFGGGMYNNSSNPRLINCLFSKNSAAKEGGGIRNRSTSTPILTNCTFNQNAATSDGGGIANMSDSSSVLTNCILWGNVSNEIVDDAPNSTVVTYSDVQGGWPGEGNIDADPCFADADNEDCHLKSKAGRWNPQSHSWVKDNVTSPCIDTGDSSSDWTAELWPHGKRTNMGFHGGTLQASMSLSRAGNIADLNFDRRLSYKDVKLLTDKWLYEALLLHEDLSRDGIVNFTDYAIFADIWGIPDPPGNPNPPDGALISNLDVDLTWMAGGGATSHDVYFGTGNPPPFISNQIDTTFDPGIMSVGTKYYWRIDEVNNSGTTTGTLWSFTTIPQPPF